MKRKNRAQPGLFDAKEFPLLFAPAQSADAQADSDGCQCAACKGTKLEVICERTGAHPECPYSDGRGAFNHCTLDGLPARVIGRSFHYATIEPLDLDAEPIRCCWQIVQDVLENHEGRFQRANDDTDE